MQHSFTDSINPPYLAPVPNKADESVAVVTSFRQLSVDDLAQQLGYPESEIIELAERGMLKGRRLIITGKWMFSPNAAELFNACIESTPQESIAKLAEEKSHRIKTADSNENTHKVIELAKIEENDMYLSKASTIEFFNSTNIETTIQPNIKSAANDSPAINSLIKAKNLESQVLNRIEIYFKSHYSHHKSLLINDALSKLKAQSTSTIPDFYTLLNLQLKFQKNKQKYRTELRSSTTNPFVTIVNEIIAGFLNKEVSVNGIRKFFFEDENESIAAFNQLIYDAAIQQHRLAEILPFEGRFVSDALTLAIHDNNSSNKKTKHDMEQYLGFWGFVFEGLKLDDITNRLLFSILNKMTEMKLSGSARTNYTSNFNKILLIAKNQGWLAGVDTLKSIPSNKRPFYEIPWSKWAKFTHIYSQHEQEERFYNCLWTSVQRHYNLLHLRDSAINFEENRLHISSTEHKSGSMIDVAMSKDTVKLLKECIEYKKRNGIDSDYVFAVDTTGNLPIIRKTSWIRSLAECGLNKDITPHSLRIYGITDMCRNGGADEDVMLVSGHTTLEGLQRYKKIARDMNRGIKVANLRSMEQ